MVLAACSKPRTRFAADDAGVRPGHPLILAAYGKRVLPLAIDGVRAISPRLTRFASKLAYPSGSASESLAEVAHCGTGR